MNIQDLNQFRTEQNFAETESEFLALLVYGLRESQEEGNELTAQVTGEIAKGSEKVSQISQKAEEQREVHASLLSYILDEIKKKDIDLSGVIAGLESVRAEIEASRQEDKEEEPVEAERHNNVLQAISALLEATRENKPETVDLSPVVEKTEETANKTQELLSNLITAIGKIDVRPEVKIDIPKEVEVKEPKWYKPFSFDTKWLKPIEYAVNAINPKPALARLEELLEKLYKKPFPTIPKTKDGSRILVEVDRTGGGGSGVINKIGDPINPATEETLQEIESTLFWLRRISKQLEPSAAADSQNRQRVAVDYIAGTTLGSSIAGPTTGGGTPIVNVPTPYAPTNPTSTTYWQQVWVGPVDQRWQIADQARNAYANGIRSNLSFS